MPSYLHLLVCLSSQLTAYLWSVVLAQIKSTQLFQGREDIEFYSSVDISSDFKAKPQSTYPKSSPVENHTTATERGQQFPPANYSEADADKKYPLQKAC